MGTHGAASTRPRALPPAQRATDSAANPTRASRPGLNLAEWPVARRLFAVIVAALLMGLILGGLRVADAEASATQFSRVSQLAQLSQQLTIMVNDLQNERDATLGQLVSGDSGPMKPYYDATNAEADTIKRLVGGIGGAYPVNIRNGAATVLADISGQRIGILHSMLNPKTPQNNVAVIADYGAGITDMINLSDQVAQGVADSTLASDVRALNALSLAKEQVSQQRALLNYALSPNAGPNLDDSHQRCAADRRQRRAHRRGVVPAVRDARGADLLHPRDEPARHLRGAGHRGKRSAGHR